MLLEIIQNFHQNGFPCSIGDKSFLATNISRNEQLLGRLTTSSNFNSAYIVCLFGQTIVALEILGTRLAFDTRLPHPSIFYIMASMSCVKTQTWETELLTFCHLLHFSKGCQLNYNKFILLKTTISTNWAVERSRVTHSRSCD